MLKYSSQPVLYLLDLPAEGQIEIPSSMPLALKAFNDLVDECRGLRCPKCGEDRKTCLASPKAMQRVPPSAAFFL